MRLRPRKSSTNCGNRTADTARRLPQYATDSPEEVKTLPSNEIVAIQQAKTQEERDAAYMRYVTVMERGGQTPKPLKDLV